MDRSAKPSSREQALMHRLNQHWAIYRLSPNLFAKILLATRAANEVKSYVQERSTRRD